MAYKDLRQYIARLEEEGEAQRIEKEVDWNLEVGAVMRRVYDLNAPAPFFQKIKEYPEGYRIFGCPVSASSKPKRYYARLALAMEMKPDTPAAEIIEEYIKRKKNPIKPILVSAGPCKENICKGDEIDLYKFPAPYLHDGDGGRYIGTWHSNITKDPDTGWVNWGMYRLMIHDKKTMGGLISPNTHIGAHFYQKYVPKNKSMEFAIAIGTEPVSAIISANFLPAGVNEVDIAGAVRGEPMELVKCETVDLEVPATSEIVIEGIVPPHEKKEEGPFGEYTGYQGGLRAPRPVYHITAITRRNDPILSVSSPGVPVYDSHVLLVRSAELLDELRVQGFPVTMVHRPPHGVHTIVISTKVPYPNYVRRLANAVWGSHVGGGGGYLIVVEDDVDITNLEDVFWALTSRCHPDRGVFKMPNIASSPLLPYLSRQEKENLCGAAILFDCTWPKEWPKEDIPIKASFDVMWPKEVQDKVLKNWKGYGYSE